MHHFLTTALILTAAPVLAAPRVATDIAPVHSLTTQVMEGVGQPDLILPIGASPHAYSMRPSEAAALQDAEIVFWIGESLTPWLERSLETIASEATAVELLGAGASIVLPTRTGATFKVHEDHDEHNDHDDDDDHAGHAKDDDHKEGDEHAEDAHHDEHAEDGHDEHDHGGQDPHAWLDPENAKAWLDVIAESLANADPANAAAYIANANAAKARLDELGGKISAQLTPLHDARFIVFHDAYQYFETRFDTPATGAISLSDAQKPSPARIAELQDLATKEKVACVFSEPQFNSGVVNAVFGGSDVRTGVLDALGASLEPGAEFYAALLTGMAGAMVECLDG